ncbi:MAG TPA: winged helix-turn-helix domain-containing protein, partial [Candidatus Polarisedimenticolaceae bacterium]|nr:winged helix-turn-helix domain-containing protein [Candidatus Polarisedimenticolaceae bacterium]
MNIPLDRDKPTALPRQIQAHLERLIHERLLTPGMKLPATRELARQLGVNRGTVALAYEELVATGWARAHVGQGTFVAERPVGGGALV